MWDLEAKLGTPLSNLEEVLVSASKGHGEIDKANLIKILQRQEAAHQIELQKWHDLLGTAAGLLKQVHSSQCEMCFCEMLQIAFVREFSLNLNSLSHT